MSPNAEEDMLTVEPWSLLKEKDRLRPPTYNAEDYAIALRRWGRRPNSNDNDSQGTLPSTTSSSSGYMSASGEMTLRQFTSVSELVNKLRADLRLAFPSFVQEFSSSPADGITLLLETLRGVQLIQSTPPSAGQSGQRISTRRAALDELGCVECLAACVERCADAPRLLSQAQPGLVALAVCLTSSLNRSRVLALQLLTKVCQIPGGYTAVSEAVSTLRLRYGEGGRFRFLAGALLAPRAAIALRVAGISFLNAFIKSAPKTQTKLYIQAEACEAGLEPRALQEWLSEDEIINNDKSLIDLLKKQVYKWSQNCIDVDSLQKRLARAEETCAILNNKIIILQNQLKKLQIDEKIITNNNYNSIINGIDHHQTNYNLNSSDIKGLQRLSLNGEDEGISSSECSRSSSSPEDIHLYNHHHHHYHKQQQHKSIIEKTNIDNDQETTIDDVIEELRTIVKDAEEEQEQEQKQKQKQIQVRIGKEKKLSLSKASYENESIIKLLSTNNDDIHLIKSDLFNSIDSIDFNDTEVNYCNKTNDITKLSRQTIKTNDVTSLKIIVQGPEVEEAIVPAILYPQPPRKIPPCLSAIITENNQSNDFLENNNKNQNNDDDHNINNENKCTTDDEIFADENDSLLSAAQLKYRDDDNDHHLYKNEDGGLYLSKNGIMIKGVSELKILKPKINDNNNNNNNNNNEKKNKNISDTASNLTEPAEYLELELFENSDNNDNNRIIKNRVEKKKLQRSVSQNNLDDSKNLNPSKLTTTKIEDRIKKFESMNLFDVSFKTNNSSPSFYSNNNNNNNVTSRRIINNGNLKKKIRRSESCHQVSHYKSTENINGNSSINNNSNSNKVIGSDSRLDYVDNYYDNIILLHRSMSSSNFKPHKIDLSEEFSKSKIKTKKSTQITKSLDRIDEGLNSLVDIVIGGTSKNNKSPTVYQNTQRNFNNNNNKNKNQESLKNSQNKQMILKNNNNRFLSLSSSSSSSSSSTSSSSISKNDKLYGRKINKSIYLGNEFNLNNNNNNNNSIDRSSNLNNDGHINDLSIIRSYSYKKKPSDKLFINDSRIFSTASNKSHGGAFGLNQNRFNAGKYSGNPNIKGDKIESKIKTVSSNHIINRCKVTDIISGLY